MATARGQIARSVADSLKAAEIPARDKAAVTLARRYAQLLDASKGEEDEVDVFDRLGPKLLAALTALGLTAAGRNPKAGGAQGVVPGGSKLDELRARRAQRPR